MRASDLLAPRKSLGTLLVEMNLISAEALDSALSAGETSDTKLGDTLVEQGLITREDLAMVVSLQTGVPFIDLKRHKIDPRAIENIPEAMARRYDAIPLEVVDNSLIVVMEDPENIQALQDMAAQSRKRIEPAIGVLDDIKKSIDLNYRASGEIERQVSQISVLDTSDDRLSAELVAQAPVVRAVDLLITQAVKDRASDIHIEPQEERLRIRYRIDGVLHEMMSLPMSVHPALVSRLKILADMNIAERRRPQDGQFDVTIGDRDVDMRVATIDTVWGEKMEIRILDRSMAVYSLDQLGLAEHSLTKFRQMLKTPYGMILVSGPTGSGKTTTLYTALNSMEHDEQSIVTIEDPVEYRFEDITSIQVNNKAGITFAASLRTVLRLDPDIIMVGEIRDTETAQVAVQAALTGHLMLSSIHANDAVGVLYRLIDLGIEPFLISSALIGVMAQRMLRRVCPHCRVLTAPTEEEALAYSQVMEEELTEYYQGKGCNLCANTGYLGRTGVHELMIITDEVRRGLLRGDSASDIKAQALSDGMLPMRKDGMMKVKLSITTPQEVLRNVFAIGGVES